MKRPLYAIDLFAPFLGSLVFRGWVAAPLGARLELKLGEQRWPVRSYGLHSPDVAKVVEDAHDVRFAETIDIGENTPIIHRATLVVTLPGGEVFEFADLASTYDAGQELQARFAQMLARKDSGALLELGSRARSGLVNTRFVPKGWDYVGMDIMDGANVDRVGDAHELSTVFPDRKFDGVMSFSVVEHLLMPWKVVIELNQVLNVGAVGLFTTHQAWPLHDAPWDFWRFSKDSWRALFNEMTGFEILGAEMSEPGFVVPQRCHAVTNFGDQPVYLSSVVMFRKTKDTDLRWNVSLSDLVQVDYPGVDTVVQT